jgi:PAS domain S-box-containing protein
MRRFDAVAMHADLRRSLVFVAGACIVAPAVASVTPAYVYVTLGWADSVFGAWRARTVSNAVATLALVPSLLAVWRSRAERRVLRGWQAVEFACLLFGLAATYAVAFAVTPEDLLGLSVLLSAATPFLIWATVRFGGAGLSFALSAALLMMSTTATHLTPITSGVPADAIVGVQLLLTATAIPLSLLAGLLRQQRVEHRTLVDVQHENRGILRALPDAILLHTNQGAVLRSYPQGGDGPVTRANLVPDSVVANVVARCATRAPGTDGAEPHVIEHTEGSDDRARRYEARSTAVDSERTVTIIRDITQDWRSRQALLDAQLRHTLAQSAGGTGLWDYDVTTGQVRVEGTLKIALGYREDEIADTLSAWQRVIFEHDREDVQARLSALVTGVTPRFEAEFRVAHKNTSLRWITLRGAVTHTTDGQPSRVIGIYVDTTERKEAARALIEANERLARLGRIAAMSELTASLAHELNQPLAAISANVEACLRGLDSQRQRALSDALDDVLHESRRASKIIERTRDLFQNRAIRPVPLNVNDVVREVARIAAPRLRELHVRMRLALDPDVRPVHLDDVQIQQVLSNLVANAADAVHAVDLPRRVIRISTRHSRRHVIVSVRDGGIGLDHADVARIFEPFYTTKATGTGMGLAISRSIVRSHGGTLWGVSNRDGGSTFRFKIPVRAGHAASSSPQTGKILVVDDNRGMRKSLTRLLRSCGYQVAVAPDGARAVALTDTFRPDALVVDLSLGDMTGLDLVKRLRSVPAYGPMVMIGLTAYDDDDLRDACIAAGFDGYLVKQTQISELPALLEQRRNVSTRGSGDRR